MPGESRRPPTRPPDRFPQVRPGCPSRRAARPRRACRAAAGRAGGPAVVLVAAVVITAAAVFAPSLLPGPTPSPPRRHLRWSCCPYRAPGAGGASGPAPRVAPSRAAGQVSAVADSVDQPTVPAQVPIGSTPGVHGDPAARRRGRPAALHRPPRRRVLTVVDTTTRAVRGTIPIDDGPPQYLAFSLDGTRAYVSVFSEQSNAQNHSVNRVVVVDTRRGRVVASIPVGTRPSALAVTPDATGSEVCVGVADCARSTCRHHPDTRRGVREVHGGGGQTGPMSPVSRGRKGKNKTKTAKSARQPVALDLFSAPRHL